MITSTTSAQGAKILPAGTATGFASLGQADFIKMMTTQLQNQDPTEPVDQKEMLAQLAQFSSLSGINTVNTTLKDISSKLDTVIASQSAATTLTNKTAA